MKVAAVPSDSRYKVSNTGIVYGISGNPLRQSLARNGYLVVVIGSRCRTVHSLILETFRGPRPDGQESLHKNGVRTNNKLSNLRYGTRAENINDSIKHGTHPWASKTHCPQKHEYTPENTLIGTRRSGSKAGHKFRTCRACMTIHSKNRVLRRRESAFVRAYTGKRLV